MHLSLITITEINRTKVAATPIQPSFSPAKLEGCVALGFTMSKSSIWQLSIDFLLQHLRRDIRAVSVNQSTRLEGFCQKVLIETQLFGLSQALTRQENRPGWVKHPKNLNVTCARENSNGTPLNCHPNNLKKQNNIFQPSSTQKNGKIIESQYFTTIFSKGFLSNSILFAGPLGSLGVPWYCPGDRFLVAIDGLEDAHAPSAAGNAKGLLFGLGEGSLMMALRWLHMMYCSLSIVNVIQIHIYIYISLSYMYIYNYIYISLYIYIYISLYIYIIIYIYIYHYHILSYKISI